MRGKVLSKKVFMFEGKHIHFSPVDNKPLCSFSNKLCRQRRLNGYAFCIRHILEDKSAPFKRCTYVTRNNNQICLNAIPTNQERGYCHSHMQVAGIIPKTERKIKNPTIQKSENGVNGVITKADSTNNSNNNSSSSHQKKDPNAVFKFEEEHSEIQWIPKGGSINGIVNGCKSTNNSTLSKGNKVQTSFKKANGNVSNGNSGIEVNTTTTTKKSAETKNGKVTTQAIQRPIQNNGILSEKGGKKERQTYGKKIITNGKNNKSDVINNSQQNGLRNRSKEAGGGEKKVADVKSVVVPRCVPEQENFFEQLKTLKSVEKSVCAISQQKNNSSNSANTTANTTTSTNGGAKQISSIFDPLRTISIPNLSNNPNAITKSGSNSLDCVNSIITHDSFSSPCWSPPDLSKRSLETRQEFLARVRQAFKFQYLTIKNAAKESENKEKIWKRALRNSLLTCVVKDSSYCAHVLVQNDPIKYSDVSSDARVLNSSILEDTPVKHKRTVPNGVHVKKGNKKCEVIKNGTSDDKNAPEIINQHSNNKSKTINVVSSNQTGLLTKPLVTSITNEKKFKSSKGTSKRITDQDSSEQSINGKKTSTINKRKPRKVAGSINSVGLVNIGMNGIQTLSGVEPGVKNAKEFIPSNNETNGLKSTTKKRKLDMCNGIKNHEMDVTSTFRVPKLEESSSSNCNGIDVKMNNSHGELLYSRFNAHLSNHPLLAPHSSATSISLPNAQLQLQHILSQPDLRTLASHRNQGLDTVLNSVGSSDMGTSDGVITDASFDSTFDHSVSSQQDCEFSDDDLEKSLEFQIDPETEHQASRLLEDNELTEDDLNELFPETRIGDNKLGRSDLSDLGIDFTSTFDANDIDYSLFANIFPFARPNQSESISVTNQF